MIYDYYFNAEHALRPYTCALQRNPGFLPSTDSLEEQPEFVPGFWPCEKNGRWIQIEDHRERNTATGFSDEVAQAGTEYWLPGDSWRTPSRKMQEIGPLPEGYLLERPEKTESEKKEQQLAEIVNRLMEIDMESSRPLRALVNGSGTDADRAKLVRLDAEALRLREEIAALSV